MYHHRLVPKLLHHVGPDCCGLNVGQFKRPNYRYQSLLPAPIVSLDINGVQNVYVAPDAVELVNLIGTAYTSYFDSIGFNWKVTCGHYHDRDYCLHLFYSALRVRKY
jgi:hypothetical protein